MNVIILGSQSDIAKELRVLMVADGWKVVGWHRSAISLKKMPRWDLILIALGRIAPVGPWHKQTPQEWRAAFHSNLFLPMRLLKMLWRKRKPGAAICWLAGSNPNTIMDGYSAYNVSKMAVLKAVEQLDQESQDAKFFALGPGTILTKIHKQSANWDNPKLEAAWRDIGKLPENAIPRLYDCLKWCLSQSKEVVGGRNICVSDPWESGTLQNWLRPLPTLYKLRREQ
jgi:NAD(P)-dependent dehydrogenase (short-subunit alcohol dehydrogenase family)